MGVFALAEEPVVTEEEIRRDERAKCAAEVEAYAAEWVDRRLKLHPGNDCYSIKSTAWQILQAARRLTSYSGAVQP